MTPQPRPAVQRSHDELVQAAATVAAVAATTVEIVAAASVAPTAATVEAAEAATRAGTAEQAVVAVVAATVVAPMTRTEATITREASRMVVAEAAAMVDSVASAAAVEEEDTVPQEHEAEAEAVDMVAEEVVETSSRHGVSHMSSKPYCSFSFIFVILGAQDHHSGCRLCISRSSSLCTATLLVPMNSTRFVVWFDHQKKAVVASLDDRVTI